MHQRFAPEEEVESPSRASRCHQKQCFRSPMTTGASSFPSHDVLLTRVSEIADVVLMRYRLEPRPGIEFVTPSSLPILGYRPDEFYASPTLGLEIVHPEDRERLEHECTRDPESTFVGRA